MTTTTTPLWLQRPVATRAPLTFDRRADLVVVGGGSAGLVTAVLAARWGLNVALLEADTVGSGTTGRSTAKVTALQGTKLSRISSRQAREYAQAYVDASIFARDWLLDYCDRSSVPYEMRHAVTYATTPEGREAAEREYDITRSLGLPVLWSEEANLPFATTGAVSLPAQFQIDPAELAGRLAADAEAAGARIYEGSRVTRVQHLGEGVRISVGPHVVDAKRAVIATNLPITYRGGFFARCRPERSFVAAFASDWDCPGMFISADKPTHSLRSATADGQRLALVCGGDYVTGRTASPAQRLHDLLSWAQASLPVGEPVSTWAAQDQVPAEALPYAGPLTPFDDRLLVATGFDKWGLTTSVAAADTLMSYLVPDYPWHAWADAFHPWKHLSSQSLKRYAELNGPVAVELAQGLARVARATATRKNRDVSMVCPHAGGIVRWNDAECSWDCPLHGSRFAPDGSVLTGPATRGLRHL